MSQFRATIHCRGRALTGWLAALSLMLTASAALAQQKTLRVKKPVEAMLPFVTTMVVPGVRGAVVSDVSSIVAFAHVPGNPVHVSIYKLDAAGQPTADPPQTLTLAKPGPLADRKTEIVAMLTHPRFPLLYVWQDVEPLPASVMIEPGPAAEFDHLMIYSLEETPPKLLLATCRGADYACGNLAGGMALDDVNGRLYVPNLRQLGPNKKDFVPTAGWLTIDPDGLPAQFDPAAPKTSTFVTSTTGKPAPPLDPAAAAAARATKLAAWPAGVGGLPSQARLTMEENASVTLSWWPAPLTYSPLNAKSVIVGVYAGIASWALDDRLSRFGYSYMQPYLPSRYRVVAHPTQPCVYVIMMAYDGQVRRFEHADGYITLSPQALYVDSMVPHAMPLVIAKKSQLVVGAAGRIVFIDLDAEGKFKEQATQMTVNNPTTAGVCWSDKFERLYVAVEKTP